MLKKFEDFFKRIKVDKNDNNIHPTQIEGADEIEIVIEGTVGVFENEKEQIIIGAKQLLQAGAAKDMQDAITTFAVMFRGLKFGEVKKDEGGKTVIVLKETVQPGHLEGMETESEMGNR